MRWGEERLDPRPVPQMTAIDRMVRRAPAALRSPVGSAVVVFGLVAAGHALGTAIVYQLSHVPSVGVTFFPASGVTLAALLLVPRRLWPVVLAATYLSELTSHFVLGEGVLSGFGMALADTVEPAVAALLVLRWVGGPPTLSRRSHLVAFVCGAVIVAPLVGLVIGPPFARMDAANGSYLATAARWGTGDALGLLVVGGLLLSWATEVRWPVRLRHPAVEAGLLAVVLVVVTWLSFWRWLPAPVYLTIPPLAWAALRFGTRGATTAGAVVTALAEWATLAGHGLFAPSVSQSREAGLWLLQLFLAVVVLTALVLASQAAEQAAAVASAEASEEKYRRIFEATSDGLIITDMATGTIVEVNPAFCNMHATTREVMVGAHPNAFVPASGGQAESNGPGPGLSDTLPELFDTYLEALRIDHQFRARARDVTSDGRVFDVEIRGIELPLDGRPHVLGVIRDVSEDAAAYRLLEERVADRTRELSGLLAVAVRLAAVVDAAQIGNVLEQDAPAVLPRCGFSVYQLRDDHLVPTNPDPSRLRTHIERLPRAMTRLWADQVVRCDGDPLATHVFAELVDSGMAPAGIRGLLLVPLVAAGELLGALAVLRHHPPRFSDGELAAARALASHAAVSMAHVRLLERTQDVAAGEARQAIARDLHDSVSQTLFSMTLHAKAAQVALHGAGLEDDHPAARALAEVVQLTRGALAEMRALIFELRPGALAEEGLEAAVSKHAGALASREGLQVEVVGPAERLPVAPHIEEQLYRLIQEALNNVVKHAHTHSARVAIETGCDDITVTIRDEGDGFDPAAPRPGHVGLASMAERAAGLGGLFSVASRPGEGTTVTVSVPLQAAGDTVTAFDTVTAGQ
jgi:signal transduction histidine kinase/integral membrane sensor domain MASE1